MKITAQLQAAVMASSLSLALVACGGDPTPGTGTGGAGGSGTGGAVGDPTTGSSSSNTSSTGSSGSMVPSLTDVANGVADTWPDPSAKVMGKTYVWMESITKSFKFLRITLSLSDAMKTGSYACGTKGTWMWYAPDTGDVGYTSDAGPGGSCTVTITQVPVVKGDMWIGTFSASLPASDGISPPLTVTDGELHLLYEENPEPPAP